ncbi:MAG TPA: PQQ-binding-like beta-propeller repeat protein [Candidatus Saccharimonadales bacterium]|nr:PQQ-binding-like beta-propeller repeat protein [Candidatus Saccharimonadales bacterium]
MKPEPHLTFNVWKLSRRRVVVWLSVFLCGVSSLGLARAEDSRVAATLGSPGYKPTPEHPVGWRGDWTGRFPGATPPLEWSRRVKAITSQITYQANRPSGKTGSFPLEYFTLKEWIVAGPFSAEDPVKEIDKDFLNGEATVEPNARDKAGDTRWKHLRAGIDTQSRHYHNEGTCGDLNVDFVYVFGNLPETGAAKEVGVPLNNKLAYAHTWIHSPSSAEVMLRINYTAAALKVFLNGKVVALKRGQPIKVALAQGWNRLLLKAASSEATAPEGQNSWVSRWRVAAYLEPVLPVSYETKNIPWMTKMTGRSMSQPIVVGDRIYVGSAMTDLLCLDKQSGKILWLRSNTPYDAMNEEQRAQTEIKEQIAPLAASLGELNEQTVKAINAAVSPAGLSSQQQMDLDKILKAKADAEKALHNALRSIDRKKYPPMYENEVAASNSTPVSDGEHVFWTCGGGMKGPGAHVVSCFDLNGKRIWSRHDASIGSPEHGSHGSPNLIDGKLIFAAKVNLMAYDPATGKELWRNAPNDWQNDLGNTSPIATKVGATNAIVVKRYIHRASDGTVICPTRLDLWGVLTPVLEDGVLYNPCRWQGWKDPVSFLAVRLPATDAPGAKTETVLDLKGADVTMPTRQVGGLFTVASPLYADGILYSVEMGGGLAAVDTRTGKGLFRGYLDGYNRYNRYLYGVAASPTLAGQHIFITDDAGYTHIFERGPRIKETRRNIIENIHLSGLGGNPCKQESFYTSPVFEGQRMYLRGEEYLYCIGQ